MREKKISGFFFGFVLFFPEASISLAETVTVTNKCMSSTSFISQASNQHKAKECGNSVKKKNNKQCH